MNSKSKSVKDNIIEDFIANLKKTGVFSKPKTTIISALAKDDKLSSLSAIEDVIKTSNEDY